MKRSTKPLKWLFYRLLPGPGRSLLLAAITASLLTFFLSLAISASAVVIIDVAGIQLARPNLGFTLSAADLAGVLLFAPIAETLLLSGLIAVLRVWVERPVFVAAIASLIWGGAHGIIAPIWFFGVLGPFFVFAMLYQSWKPLSLRRAYTVVILAHVFHNAYGVAIRALTS